VDDCLGWDLFWEEEVGEGYDTTHPSMRMSSLLLRMVTRRTQFTSCVVPACMGEI